MTNSLDFTKHRGSSSSTKPSSLNELIAQSKTKRKRLRKALAAELDPRGIFSVGDRTLTARQDGPREHGIPSGFGECANSAPGKSRNGLF